MADVQFRKTIKLRSITIGVFALALYLIVLFSGYPSLIERYYSKGFYSYVCRILHPVLNLFPFSVGDLLYIIIVIYLVCVLFKLMKFFLKKLFPEAAIYLLQLIISIQVFVLIFYLFWGINYYRPSAGVLLNLKDTGYTTVDLKVVTKILIDSANICRTRLTNADLLQDDNHIFKIAIKAISKLSVDSVNFRTFSPGIKPSLLTPLINYLGTSGYFNPFTGEAQINYQMPVFDRPIVACHEMSHQMGYGAEDEANFAGFLAGIGSSDRLLRYSAYRLGVDEFMHALYYRDSTASKELKPGVSALVHQDFVVERAYWRSYQNKVGIISSMFYDSFLKVNNQPQGLDTYNRMVLLVMARYKNKRDRNKFLSLNTELE